MHQPLLPAITLKAMLDGLDVLGFDTEAMTTAVGLAPRALEDPFVGLPDDTFGRLWTQAFAQDPTPDLPTKAGFAVRPGAFGLLDHIVESAETVGEGLHALNVFFWLVSTGIHLEFEHAGSDIMWLEQTPYDGGVGVSEQWTLAVCAQRFRDGFQENIVSEVYLTYEGLGQEALFSHHYGVPVRLNSDRGGLKLIPGAWGRSMPLANRVLGESLRTAVDRIEIEQFEEAPLVYAVRTRLPDLLQAGEFSVEAVAERLDISSRTLQRQLAQENLTFKQLLDGYRRDCAFEMLRNRDASFATIAYDLGYNEQSSFNRAFRRWTGKSPSQWRASL